MKTTHANPELDSPHTYEAFLAPEFSISDRVLIIGCGGGHHSRLYPNAVNVDIDLGCLKLAKSRGIANLILADASHLPIKYGFDKVLLADVLEHLPSKEILDKIIFEIRGLIKTMGIVAVIMPSKDRLLAVRKAFNASLGLPCPIMAHPEHTLSITKDELINAFGMHLIKDAGIPGSLFGLRIGGIGGEYIHVMLEAV